MRNFDQYQKALSRALNCSAPLRRRLMDHVYQTVQDFQAENPDADWPEIEAYLGAPRTWLWSCWNVRTRKNWRNIAEKRIYGSGSFPFYLPLAWPPF